MIDVWFWQRMLSPHMMGLAVALTRKGCKVSFVSESAISEERSALGWETPETTGVAVHHALDKRAVASLVAAAHSESIHICQGIRANGLVSSAQAQLAARGLRQWVVMETVDDAGVLGWVKRLTYSWLFRRQGLVIEGVLASGYKTAEWVRARGVCAERVFPFAYFLPPVPNISMPCTESLDRPFRVIFVGQFVGLKRLDQLIQELACLKDLDFELWVVGAGPLEEALRAQAEAMLPKRHRWLGRRQSSQVLDLMSQCDCLVLPSRHDGWGAVVSEALLVGTPAVCSSACGSAGVVWASGVGGVFEVGNASSLRGLLREVIQAGAVTSDLRGATSTWARALNGDAGAGYLIDILSSKPAIPPWELSAAKASP